MKHEKVQKSLVGHCSTVKCHNHGQMSLQTRTGKYPDPARRYHCIFSFTSTRTPTFRGQKKSHKSRKRYCRNRKRTPLLLCQLRPSSAPIHCVRSARIWLRSSELVRFSMSYCKYLDPESDSVAVGWSPKTCPEVERLVSRHLP
jgi:hypothetical protein